MSFCSCCPLRFVSLREAKTISPRLQRATGQNLLPPQGGGGLGWGARQGSQGGVSSHPNPPPQGGREKTPNLPSLWGRAGVGELLVGIYTSPLSGLPSAISSGRPRLSRILVVGSMPRPLKTVANTSPTVARSP